MGPAIQQFQSFFNFTGPAADDGGGPALGAATEFARVDAFQWLIYN